MKISDLLENTENKMPHLYLDMDGVQADFFGAWANKHNVEHYKAIKDKEKEIDELANSSGDQVYNFFRTLAPLKGGMQIINWLHSNKISFTVLSAPLRGPYAKASIQAKKDWLDEHNPGTSGNAIFTSAKYKYAKSDGTPNILVDDFGKYLDAWHSAGGIAVKHEDEFEVPNTGARTIEALTKLYAPYLQK
jgi:5'(3')-deoxyribonucleotidase